MRVRIAAVVSVVATLAAVAVGGAAPAAASARPYCVLHASQGGTTDCYATFTEAIADATNGVIANAPATTKAAKGTDLDRRINAAAAPAGSARAKAAAGGTLIGISYWDIDYEGAAWVVESDRACDNERSTGEWSSNFPGHAWDNQLSSAKVFANCWAFFWDPANYRAPGAATSRDFADFRDFPSYPMNDKTTSLYYT